MDPSPAIIVRWDTSPELLEIFARFLPLSRKRPSVVRFAYARNAFTYSYDFLSLQRTYNDQYGSQTRRVTIARVPYNKVSEETTEQSAS